MTKKNKSGLYQTFICIPNIQNVTMNLNQLNRSFAGKILFFYGRNYSKIYCKKCVTATLMDTFETNCQDNKTNFLLEPSDEPLRALFFNGCFDKNRLKLLVTWSLKNCGQTITIDLVESLKTIGFKYATKAGISLGIDDLKIPPTKNKFIINADRNIKKTEIHYQQEFLTGIEKFQHLIDTWHRTSEVLKQNVISHFKSTNIFNPVYMMAFSGARGNVSQVRQLVGMRGLMSNPKGQIIDFPIKSNFREGLTLTEYIISCYGARKGIVDTALKTANSGYLTRRLVDVSHHIIVSNFDCKTKRGVILNTLFENKKIIIPLQTRLVGRILAENIYFPTYQKSQNLKKNIFQSKSKLVLNKYNNNTTTNNHNKLSFLKFNDKANLIETKNKTLILTNNLLIFQQIKKNASKCVLFFHILLFYKIKISIPDMQLNVISKTLFLFFRNTKNNIFKQQTEFVFNKDIEYLLLPRQTQLFFKYNLKDYYLFYEKNNSFYTNQVAVNIQAAEKISIFKQLYIEYSLNIEYLKLFLSFITDTFFYHTSRQLLGLKNQEISASLSAKLSNLKKAVLVRSPLTCEIQNSMCQLCYGWGLAYGKLVPLGEAVGVIAGQSIGEPGTQLTMRTFHTGGVFSGDIMSEILAPFDGKILFSDFLQGILIRTSHGKIAFLTKISGSFEIQKTLNLKLLKKNTNNDFTINNKEKKQAYHKNIEFFKIPSLTILFVRNHELVSKNQLIAEFSSIFTDANQRIQAKHNLHAEIDGEVFFKKMVLKIKTQDNQLVSRTTCDLGSIWVLSGKIRQQNISMNLFCQGGDLVDTNSILYQYKIISPYQGMQKSWQIKKKNIQNYIYSSLSKIPETNSQKNNTANLSKISQKNAGFLVKSVEKPTVFQLIGWLEYSLVYFFIKSVQYKKIGYFFKLFRMKQTLFSLNNLQLKNHCFFLYHSFNQNFLNSTNYTKNLFFRSFPKYYQTQTGGNIIYDKFYLNEKNFFGEIFWVPQQTLLINNKKETILNNTKKFFNITFFINISKYTLKKKKIKKILKENFKEALLGKKKKKKKVKKKFKFSLGENKTLIFVSNVLLKKSNVNIYSQINVINKNFLFLSDTVNFINKNKSLISYSNSQGKIFNFYSVFNGYTENYNLSTLISNSYKYSFWSKSCFMQLNNNLKFNSYKKIPHHISKNQKFKLKKTSFNYRFHQTNFNINPSIVIFGLLRIHLQIKKITKNKKLYIFFTKYQNTNLQEKLELNKQNIFNLHSKILKKEFPIFSVLEKIFPADLVKKPKKKTMFFLLKNLWENLYAKYTNPSEKRSFSQVWETNLQFFPQQDFDNHGSILLKNKQTYFIYYFFNLIIFSVVNFGSLQYKKNQNVVETMQNYTIILDIFSQFILFEYYTVSNNAFLYSYLYSIKENRTVQLNFLTKKRIVMLYPQFPWKHFKKSTLKIKAKFKFYFLSNKIRKKTLTINNTLYTKNYAKNNNFTIISQKLSFERESLMTQNVICDNVIKTNTHLKHYFLSTSKKTYYHIYKKTKKLQCIHTNKKYYQTFIIDKHKKIQNEKQFSFNNIKQSSNLFLPKKKNSTIHFYTKPGTDYLSVSQLNNTNKKINPPGKPSFKNLQNSKFRNARQEKQKTKFQRNFKTLLPNSYIISTGKQNRYFANNQLNKKHLTLNLAWKNYKLKSDKQINKIKNVDRIFYGNQNRTTIKPGWVYISQNFKQSIKKHNYIINSGKKLKRNKDVMLFKNIHKNKSSLKFCPIMYTIGFDQYPVYFQCITIPHIFIHKNIDLMQKVFKLYNKTLKKKMYTKFTKIKSNNYNNKYTKKFFSKLLISLNNTTNIVYNKNFCIKKNFKHYFLLKNWYSLFFFNKLVLNAIINTKKIKKNKLHVIYEIFIYKKNLYKTFLKQINKSTMQSSSTSTISQTKYLMQNFFQKIYFLKNKNFCNYIKLITRNNSKRCIQINEIILPNFFQYCFKKYKTFCNSNKHQIFAYSFTVNINSTSSVKKNCFHLSIFCENNRYYVYHIPLFSFTNSNCNISLIKNVISEKLSQKLILLKFHFFNIRNFLSLKKNYLYKKIFVVIDKACHYSFYNVIQYKNSILKHNSFFYTFQSFITKKNHERTLNFAQFSSNNKQNITNLFWQFSSPDLYIQYCFKHCYSKKILFLHSVYVFEYYIYLNMPTYYKYNQMQINFSKKPSKTNLYTIGMYLNISISINLKLSTKTYLQNQFLSQINSTDKNLSKIMKKADFQNKKVFKEVFAKNKYVYSQTPIQSIPILSKDCGEILKKNSYKQNQKSFPYIKIKDTTFHHFFSEIDLWENYKKNTEILKNSANIPSEKQSFSQVWETNLRFFPQQSFTKTQANKTETENRKFVFNLQKEKQKTFLILTDNNKTVISIDSLKNKNMFLHWFWIGKTIQYANKINKNVVIPLSGMIIQIEKSKIIVRKAQSILFSPKALLHVYPFDIIEKNTVIISLFYQRLKTGDIVQGIPRIEQLFEARKTNQGEILSNNLNVQAEKIFSYYTQKYNFVEAAKYSLEKIQQIIVNNVQKVYKSQGVSIADKHLEIIIRQMTSKVKIIQGGQTNLLPGEIIDLDWIELINQSLENHQATYVPVIFGITKKSLQTKSFLSEASFQETTKVLARSAIQRKTDFLKGLKENVILGGIIPAGTGFYAHTKFYKKIFDSIQLKYYDTQNYESYISFRKFFLLQTQNNLNNIILQKIDKKTKKKNSVVAKKQ